MLAKTWRCSSDTVSLLFCVWDFLCFLFFYILVWLQSQYLSPCSFCTCNRQSNLKRTVLLLASSPIPLAMGFVRSIWSTHVLGIWVPNQLCARRLLPVCREGVTVCRACIIPRIREHTVKLSFVQSMIPEILGKYLLVRDYNSWWKRGIEGCMTANLAMQVVFDRKPRPEGGCERI